MTLDERLQPEPGWQPIQPFPVSVGRFVSGDPSQERFLVRYFSLEDGRLVGKAWFGPDTLGPPGHAHGGSIAALLDEAMSAAAWQAGHPVLAGRLSVDFRNLLPVGSVVGLECRVVRRDGRKIHCAGRLSEAQRGVIAEAEGLFVRMTDEQLAALSA